MYTSLYCRIHLFTTASVCMILTFRASHGRVQSAAVRATLPRTQCAPWLGLSTSSPALRATLSRTQCAPWLGLSTSSPALKATLPRTQCAPWLGLSTSSPALRITLPRTQCAPWLGLSTSSLALRATLPHNQRIPRSQPKSRGRNRMIVVHFLSVVTLKCFPDSMVCTRGCNYSFMYS